jgi:hypothetical protein
MSIYSTVQLRMQGVTSEVAVRLRGWHVMACCLHGQALGGTMHRAVLIAAAFACSSAAFATKAGGVEWSAPSVWKPEPDRPMRAATYKVPATKGDSEDAELAVFFFGPGQGGNVQDNLKRWIGQFTQPDGKPSESAAKTHDKKVGQGLKATFIELGGTYTGMGGPMAPVKTEKPGYRLLGAIVEAPQGNVFFKLTGPAKTVEASKKTFEAMLSSVKKAP